MIFRSVAAHCRALSSNVQHTLLVALCLASSPLVLCAQARPDAPPPSIVDRVRIDPSRPIDFHAALWPDTVYVGQQVNYQVGVFLSENARSRLRRNPEFLPPELRGLIAYELGSPRRAAQRQVGGTMFDAHVFQRALFPVAAGDIAVPPPQLSYSLPRSASYFSREETYVVRAESAHVFVRALPEVGKPADYNGAVGRFTASARVDNSAPRVGDPLVYTMRVQGVGNIKLLPRPVLEVQWASVVPGSERLAIDSAGVLISGWKEFDWILTPTVDGPVELPPMHFAYFDPYAQSYKLAETGALTFAVAGGTVIANEDNETTALLPLRTTLTSGGMLQRVSDWRDAIPLTAWLIIAGIVPFPALLLGIYGRRTTSAQSAEILPPDLESLAQQSLASGDVVERSHEARTVRRALHHALARRLNVRLQQLTNRRHVARLLRRRGATRETVGEMLQLMEQLDHAGFGQQEVVHGSSFAGEAARLFAKVESETMHPGAGNSRFSNASVVVLLSWQMLSVQPTLMVPRASTVAADSTLEKDFQAAVDVYQHRRFTEAASRFSSLAERAPQNTDILANWGTAAWAQGDTVNAVVAWQRAARREPLAADLQERIALLPSGARGGIAEIPMIPADALLIAGVVLWSIGWLAFAAFMFMVRSRRVRAEDSLAPSMPMAARNIALLLVTGGALLGGYGFWQRDTSNPSSLYVVSRPETMRARGGVEADAMGGVGTGDVVQLLHGNTPWVQVQHADGRVGWLPAARLVPIADSPLTR